MSWLYSIFLAGLAFSTSSQPLNVPTAPTNAVVRSAAADETEHFDQTYPLSPNGRVSLSNVNGSVTVEAWDRNEVRVEYTKTADSKERLNDVDVRIESRADSISIQTDYENWKKDNSSSNDHGWRFSGKMEVTFKLTVPRGALLSEIETVNGSVDLADFTNVTKVSTVNGSVNARNLRGAAKLSTVNGEVHADFDRLESGSRISLDTVNGRVNLVIPSDSSATVKADSLNGNISNDFGLPVRKGKYVGRDLYGRIGSGDAQIKLSSVNGGLSIGHKNDGRPLSPGVNLLPAKAKDDDDWDSDVDVDMNIDVDKIKIDKEKISKEVRESIRDSQRTAMKTAKVEMEKVEPELRRAIVESATAAAQAVDPAMIQRSIDDAVRAVNAVYLPGVPRVETKSGTFPVRGVPTVTIEGSECSVKVVGWDRPEVQYRVIGFSNRRNASPMQVTDTHTDTSVDIKVVDPDLAGRAASYYDDHERVRIEVMVPKNSNLHIKARGEIRLDGVSGQLEIAGSAGAVNVRDSDGRLHVTTDQGRIRVIGFRGDVEAIAADAPIGLEGQFASLTARSGSRDINLTLPADSSADLESNCNAITGDGIPVVRLTAGDSRSTYRIGKGGGAHFVLEGDGRIAVRSSDTLARLN